MGSERWDIKVARRLSIVNPLGSLCNLHIVYTTFTTTSRNRLNSFFNIESE